MSRVVLCFFLQSRVCDTVQLDNRIGELETYCLVWELQPFVDEDLLDYFLREFSEQ